MDLDPDALRDTVRRALDEDLGDGDLTSTLCVPTDAMATARILGRQPGLLAGLPVVFECLRALDEAARIDTVLADGDAVRDGDVVLKASARAHALLAAERTALNFLQRLSGIATMTRAFVDAVEGTGARIFDTRKTTPGLRMLEKYAVRVGGGHNHRFGLYDQVLIKENHFALAGRAESDVVRTAVAGSSVPVVAEARDADAALGVVRGGAGVVLLDNFVPGAELRDTVQRIRSARDAVEIEVSGGINLDNVAEFAACGVDRISVGALTHSAPALDLSLLVEGQS